jgi:hypothetical protein
MENKNAFFLKKEIKVTKTEKEKAGCSIQHRPPPL